MNNLTDNKYFIILTFTLSLIFSLIIFTLIFISYIIIFFINEILQIFHIPNTITLYSIKVLDNSVTNLDKFFSHYQNKLNKLNSTTVKLNKSDLIESNLIKSDSVKSDLINKSSYNTDEYWHLIKDNK